MKQNKASRREFFRQVKEACAPEELKLLRVGRPAMGSRFEMLFPASERKKIRASHEALDEIRRLERLMTVFDSESRISQLNRQASSCPIMLENELFEILKLSIELGVETGGAFDVAAGALWNCWGFHKKQGAIPSDAELENALARVGSRFVDFDTENRTIHFLKEGLEINLGSIGKGFALDRAANMLQNAGLKQVLLHAGQSSFLALGDPSSPLKGWRVSIRHPVDGEADFVTLRLRNMGMGTSGIGEQYFEVDGKRYGHIIDPRNGKPVQHTLSATALAPSAAMADALSTAFFAMSLEAVDEYCIRHPEVGAIIVPAGEGELEMHCFGTAVDYVNG